MCSYNTSHGLLFYFNKVSQNDTSFTSIQCSVLCYCGSMLDDKLCCLEMHAAFSESVHLKSLHYKEAVPTC